MGRRSINTTKSGKYMNPTDQARKEARKKELKKNKKQRQMVRAAVLKGKDPAQILEEMEKIDEMEYNVYQPSPLNEKVLREKRKKLKETFDRVMRLYHNDDPELWAELKRKEVEYEKRRLKKQQYYESVKHAQTVQVDEIPLPQMNSAPATPFPNQGRVPIPNALPIPPFVPGPPPGILKKPAEKKIEEKPVEIKKKEPPGCPPCPPPDLEDFSELDTDAEDDEPPKSKKTKSIRFSDETRLKDSRRRGKDDDDRSRSRRSSSPESSEIVKPTSLQQRMLAISGQNIDDFMKEMENVHKKKEQEKENDNSKNSSSDEENEENKDQDESDKSDSDSEDEKEEEPKTIEKASEPPIPLPPIPAPPPMHAITLPSGPPPPPIGLPPTMIFRPPPLRPGIPGLAIRMPPGPPPGRPGMPPGPGGLPPRLGIRMPPGPPPGLPPNRMLHHHNQKGQLNTMKDSKGVTTITAKPKIRNLSADVTRFVPSTLRVKREDKQKPKPKQYPQETRQVESNKGATKDDAYMQFMREMQGLL